MTNMYTFINKMWNPVGGACQHDCHYCYVKSNRRPAVVAKYTGELRLYPHEFKSLGKGHFYFICHMIDLFADAMPDEFILRVLEHCGKYDNRYLFQTKNTIGIQKYRLYLPADSIVGATIETNRVYPQMGDTPKPEHRMFSIHLMNTEGFKTMVTIEPIMDFDLDEILNLVYLCNPEWVNIGADSKGHNLPEPPPEKIKALIEYLRADGIDVRLKSNLKRLLPEMEETP